MWWRSHQSGYNRWVDPYQSGVGPLGSGLKWSEFVCCHLKMSSVTVLHPVSFTYIVVMILSSMFTRGEGFQLVKLANLTNFRRVDSWNYTLNWLANCCHTLCPALVLTHGVCWVGGWAHGGGGRGGWRVRAIKVVERQWFWMWWNVFGHFWMLIKFFEFIASLQIFLDQSYDTLGILDGHSWMLGWKIVWPHSHIKMI